MGGPRICYEDDVNGREETVDNTAAN